MRFSAIEGKNAPKKEALLSASRFRAFARKLVFTAKVAVEAIPIGQLVQRFVQERIRDFNTAEQAKAVQQTFALEYLGSVPVVFQSEVGEFHRVFEYLHEPLAWIACDGPAIHDHAVASIRNHSSRQTHASKGLLDPRPEQLRNEPRLYILCRWQLIQTPYVAMQKNTGGIGILEFSIALL